MALPEVSETPTMSEGLTKRVRRPSVEEALKRCDTVGSGLNQIEDIQETLYEATEDSKAHRKASKAPARESPKRGWVSAELLTAVLVASCGILVRVLIGEATGELVGVAPPNWLVISYSLFATALLVVGVGNAAAIANGLLTAPSRSWLLVPLTDAKLSIGTLNKFANSAQCREKGLKIAQYIFKGAAYSKYFSKDLTKHLKDLSKMTSICRRFFKFCRWVKHFEDLSEAAEQKSATMKFLLYFRIAANFGADWAEDVCSLERIGLLPKGTLSVGFMLFAE